MDMTPVHEDLANPLLPVGNDEFDEIETPNVAVTPSLLKSEPSALEPSCQVHPNEQPRVNSKISALSLAMIIFYNVAGGPFGIEPAVKAAGNFYAIIGIALMPFLWSVPEMYMTYRLSTLYPCASGGVLWCETAFGSGAGLVYGYLGWLGGVVNAATFPALLYEYIMSQFYPDKGASEVDPGLRYALMLLLVLLMSLINYRGLDMVGKASISIYVVTMSAFLVMVIMGIPKVDPQKWLQTPDPDTVEQFDDDSLTTNGWLPFDNIGGIDFRVLINTLYWNFSNFDQAGHYSVSVRKKTFQRGMIISIFLTSSAYLFPVLVATGATDIDQADWKAGAFAVAGTEIGGAWLGNWIVLSTAISVVGSFCTEIAADSMQLMGMSDRAQIPSLFSHRSRFDTPTYSLLLCVIVIACILPLQFGIIVELTNFSYCLGISMEFLAFVKLQILYGDNSLCRKISYSLLVTPAFIINVLVILLASYATYIYAAIVIVIILLAVNAKSLRSFAKKPIKSSSVESNSVGSQDKTVD